jgi:ABC-type glycerol-3-phosphate transport system substrate-binding protein|uniref:ABC transporter substrate-binding protein n=2 Tax=Cephaloticoccus sp. TaxID=1985742 RepID=UPI0040490608
MIDFFRRFKIWSQFLLLFVIFGLCTYIIISRKAETQNGKIILRVSHLFKEPSADAAMEAIGQAYSKLHPEVSVIFLKVPGSIFLQWFRTQLISDTPPDIIQYDLWHRDLRQMVAESFEPINDLVDRPNPYNQATSLAGVPLRETYVDGLQGDEAYFPEMGAYFGLPYRGVTLRVMYNRDLMEQIKGDPDWTPSNWREFISLCEQTEDYAREHQLKLFPIAADKFGIYLMGNEAAIGVSQKLALRTNYDYDFTLVEPNLYPTLRYLRGEWNLRSPEIMAGLQMYREVARHMQPGFLQYDVSDVNFQFLQGHALMTIAGGPSFSDQAGFSLGAFRIPGITPHDPEYGDYVLGPYSEAKHASTYAFGIPRKSLQKEVALDFLQFLTSQPINQSFTDASGEVPVIREVRATPLASKFLPHLNGYLYGIMPRGLGDVSTRQVFSENLYLLFQGEDGVGDFINTLEQKGLMEVAIRDTQAQARRYQRNLRETDAAFTAQSYLEEAHPHESRTLDKSILRQTMFELDFLRITYSLDQAQQYDETPQPLL